MAKKSRKDQSSPEQPAESPIVIKGGFEWIPSRDQPVEFSKEFWSQCKVILHFAERLYDRLGEHRKKHRDTLKIPLLEISPIDAARNELELSIFLMPRPNRLLLRGLKPDLSQDERNQNLENIQYHRDKLTGSREATEELFNPPWIRIFHSIWNLVVELQEIFDTASTDPKVPVEDFVDFGELIVELRQLIPDKHEVEILQTYGLQDKTEKSRLLTDLPGEQVEPAAEAVDSGSLVSARKSSERSYLGLVVDREHRTVSRKDCDKPVDLNNSRVGWTMFLAVFKAEGESLTEPQLNNLEGDPSGRRTAKSELNKRLRPLAVKIDQNWRLVSDGSDSI